MFFVNFGFVVWDAHCVVKEDGGLSYLVKVQRGNRQGCHIFGQLYLVWLLNLVLLFVRKNIKCDHLYCF